MLISQGESLAMREGNTGRSGVPKLREHDGWVPWHSEYQPEMVRTGEMIPFTFKFNISTRSIIDKELLSGSCWRIVT